MSHKLRTYCDVTLLQSYVESVKGDTLIDHLKTLLQDLDTIIQGFDDDGGGGGGGRFFELLVQDTTMKMDSGLRRFQQLSNRLTNRSDSNCR